MQWTDKAQAPIAEIATRIPVSGLPIYDNIKYGDEDQYTAEEMAEIMKRKA